ncbi:MAG: hypothetical protein CR992_00520 [Desulfobacterales bacterium]|nr:MAG: hypothetical protein CR992_00520 [Desulfobacterales bacterium]
MREDKKEEYNSSLLSELPKITNHSSISNKYGRKKTDFILFLLTQILNPGIHTVLSAGGN